MVGLLKNTEWDGEDAENAENPYMHVLTRKDWGAHPPMDGIPKMQLPLKHVRFTHTGTGTCSNHDECKKLIKKIQYEQMETLGHKDITYNFMIGAEGYVYEGRGWENEPDRPAAHSELKLSSLDIAYIGDYEDEAPSASLLRAAFELVVFGVRTKRLYYFFEGVHLT